MSNGRTPLFRNVMRLMRNASATVSSGSTSAGASRRDFMRMTTAASLGAALGVQAQDAAVVAKKVSGPVAIVGGGIAGLTSAYRLMKAGIEVHLYEASKRVGGRMWTKRDFNKDGMFVELGGELVDTNHTDLQDLAKELGIEIQSLKDGDMGVDFYHFGGKLYTDKEIIPAFEPLAKRIAADAEGIQDEKEEYTAKGKNFDNTSLADYLKSISSLAEPWVAKLLEIAYVPEFGVDADKQSALNLIDFIDPDTTDGFKIFGESDEAFRVRGGNETLPQAVLRAIQGSVKLKLDHKLVRINEDGSKLKLTFSSEDSVFTQSYENVIMAIPFTMLRGVDGLYDLKLTEEKKRSIREMGFGTNVKVMYGFTETPWRERQGASEFFCNGSVYSDLPFQTVWETSRGQSGKSGIITNFMGGSAGAQFTTDRLEKSLAELDTIFPGIKAKTDGNRTMMNWPQMKFMKASYSSPLIGQYTWVYEAAATAELNGRLMFAGEHTDVDSPGYMNGGVKSGNRVAKELLGDAA